MKTPPPIRAGVSSFCLCSLEIPHFKFFRARLRRQFALRALYCRRLILLWLSADLRKKDDSVDDERLEES